MDDDELVIPRDPKIAQSLRDARVGNGVVHHFNRVT